MSYTLQHTAEAIDYKLNLIEKNKNLLPYPYEYMPTLPAGLEDVGDGSILTSAKTTAVQKILLNTCSLPAGKYTVSLDIADITEVPVPTSAFSLEVTGTAVSATTDSSGIATLNLDTITAVKVYLKIHSEFDADLLLKPQIEEGENKTTWVPYMDKIGNYVDERFNSTNTKLKNVLAFMKLVEIEDT